MGPSQVRSDAHSGPLIEQGDGVGLLIEVESLAGQWPVRHLGRAEVEHDLQRDGNGGFPCDGCDVGPPVRAGLREPLRDSVDLHPRPFLLKDLDDGLNENARVMEEGLTTAIGPEDAGPLDHLSQLTHVGLAFEDMCHPRGQDRIDEALLASCELVDLPRCEEVVDPARDPEFIVVLERLIVQASEPIRVHHGNGLIEDRLGLASL